MQKVQDQVDKSGMAGWDWGCFTMELTGISGRLVCRPTKYILIKKLARRSQKYSYLFSSPLQVARRYINGCTSSLLILDATAIKNEELDEVEKFMRNHPTLATSASVTRIGAGRIVVAPIAALGLLNTIGFGSLGPVSGAARLVSINIRKLRVLYFRFPRRCDTVGCVRWCHRGRVLCPTKVYNDHSNTVDSSGWYHRRYVVH